MCGTVGIVGVGVEVDSGSAATVSSPVQRGLGGAGGARLRIALVYAHLNHTGSLPRVQVQLARYLVAAGHEVHAYSFAPTREPSLTPGVHFHDVPATPVSASRLGLAMHVATFARNATRMIERDRPRYDVVHGRGLSTWEQDIVHVTGVVSGEIRRDRRSRESEGLGQRAKGVVLPVIAPIVLVRKLLERRIFEVRTPYEIHAEGRLARDDLLSEYDVDPARVRVVTPAVDLDEFCAPADRIAARRAVDVPEGGVLILFCGASFERKGLDRALLALGRMHENARLAVVGGDDDRAHYEALARRVGVAERVHFFGPRTDTWRFFQAADIFVLPTRVDMWGMTVLEAMASSLPAVTTLAAGAADVITHDENGFALPEPLDVDLLATTLDRLADDSELRRRIGESARQRVRGLTWDAHGRQVEEGMMAVAEYRSARRPRAPERLH